MELLETNGLLGARMRKPEKERKGVGGHTKWWWCQNLAAQGGRVGLVALASQEVKKGVGGHTTRRRKRAVIVDGKGQRLTGDAPSGGKSGEVRGPG